MHCDRFEDLIFVDDKLPAKTVKITSLEICTYNYGINQVLSCYIISYIFTRDYFWELALAYNRLRQDWLNIATSRYAN